LHTAGEAGGCCKPPAERARSERRHGGGIASFQRGQIKTFPYKHDSTWPSRRWFAGQHFKRCPFKAPHDRLRTLAQPREVGEGIDLTVGARPPRAARPCPELHLPLAKPGRAHGRCRLRGSSSTMHKSRRGETQEV